MEENKPKKSLLSNKTYDILKTIAAILPLVGAFYYGLSEIWGIPYGAPIQATFALIASTLSGILIKLSHDYSKMQQALLAEQINNTNTETEEVPAEMIENNEESKEEEETDEQLTVG